MKLTPFQRSLAKSFALGTLFGLAVIFVAGRFFSTDGLVGFREADRHGLERARAEVVSYASAVDAAAPAVVNVHTAKRVKEAPLRKDPFYRHFFDQPDIPRERLETSLGSGVIVSDKGFILTNHHVIKGAEAIQVGLRDGRIARAQVVGTDPESDLAVLRIELDDLPVITLGHSDELRTGDVVLAIGNPFGVGQTVTMGIVSATGRSRLGISTFENFIQTDAAINPGNSGGALINALGELVGINTAIFTRSGGSEGIGFAIPINLAKKVTEQIIRFGQAVRGWLGVEVQEITPELAESFRMERPRGVLVAGVLKDGPAYQAGLRPGDVILAIDGQPVHDGREAMNRIADMTPGQKVELTILRQGKTFTVTAEVGLRPLPQAQG